MADVKCKDCGRLVLNAVCNYCFYCWNKERIENGGFKPGPRKLAEKAKK